MATKTNMTFHESYGTLSTKALRLVKKHNVSPSDWDDILDQLGNAAWNGVDEGLPGADWSMIEQHIIDNSPEGYYVPKFF